MKSQAAPTFETIKNKDRKALSYAEEGGQKTFETINKKDREKPELVEEGSASSSTIVEDR